MGTKWEQSENKNIGNKVGTRTPKQSGNKVETRTPKWDKNENKLGNKWEQEPQSGAGMRTMWEQEPQNKGGTK